MNGTPGPSLLTRRQALATAAGGLVLVVARPARATPEAMQDVIRTFTGGAKVTEGRVKLDVTLLVENGNSVPLSVSVDSPMTAADHVVRIGVFNEKNPLPDVAIFNLTPRCGRATAATRIRLNDTQMITAIAQMKDGSFWSDTSEVIVTLPACVEG
ncbi:MAG: SoxY-related arm protein [Hyphomicrobiales bacterium]|nr:SoxY-related arm protein [Hyphomicrobiales bacterium]